MLTSLITYAIILDDNRSAVFMLDTIVVMEVWFIRKQVLTHSSRVHIIYYNGTTIIDTNV